MNATLTDALRRLRLSGLARVLDVRLQEAAGNHLSHADFLELILADELVVRDFLEDEALGGADNILDRYLKPDLLIIDDMGLKQLPKHSGEHLFEIVLRRYENRSTIMTSNRPLEDWGKLIGDVPAATAILDRFLHHAEIIEIAGRSYRLKDKARQKPKQPCKEGKEEVQ